MNAPVKRSSFSASASAADPSAAFESARSQLLDAFFELEVATSKWLRFLGDRESARPLGQRLDHLAGHPMLEAKATAKQARQIRVLTQECAKPLQVRNAAVHSRREAGTKGDEACYFLATLETALDDERRFVVVTLNELAETARQARSLAGQLLHYLNQASLPRRPSPDAATDP